MNADERITLHALVDRAVRARLEALIAAGELEACRRCGCPTDCYTPACLACWDRHRYKVNPRRRAQLRSRERQRRQAAA